MKWQNTRKQVSTEGWQEHETELQLDYTKKEHPIAITQESKQMGAHRTP